MQIFNVRNLVKYIYFVDRGDAVLPRLKQSMPKLQNFWGVGLNK